MKKLREIQKELKAPKNSRNTFGNYNYRSAEDILEAVKPLLFKHGCTMVLSDKIKGDGDFRYVEATVKFIEDDSTLGKGVTVKASAGIQLQTKGMNYAQTYGSSSSYARKYALNGLFLIDDNKDSDVTNKHEEKKPDPIVPKKDELVKGTKRWENIVKRLGAGSASIRNITDAFTVTTADMKELKTFVKK